MSELIKISEEQIKVLKEMQGSEIFTEDAIQISSEIRKWCEFIYKIKSL